GVIVLIGGAVGLSPKHRAASAVKSTLPVTSFRGLVALPVERVAQVPITQLNLLCAEGLWPERQSDIKEYETALSAWAQRVMSETERHFYRFQQDPAQFENSEGFFRMLMLSVVLAEDFKVHYDDDRKLDPQRSRLDDGFFADPQHV